MFIQTLLIALSILLSSATTCFAQQTESVATDEGSGSEATAREAIDNRPTPKWWRDAKFGIFIHWGVYSVPAYSKVGRYSEWYWRDLLDAKRDIHESVKEFHNRVYGPRFAYPDFAAQSTCEFFDADQWATLFEESGAKYVVLTSKHHDGDCLWPSAESDKSWGRPWSSTNSGPGRDLLGELTTAVHKTDVKMGMARKEALFTRKGETLYTICPVFPDETLTLKNVTAVDGATISMLDHDGALNWKQNGQNIDITIPRMNPARLPCSYAWTFKVSAIKASEKSE